MRNKRPGAGVLVEDHFTRLIFVSSAEVEQIVERSGNRIERAARLDALARQPVVLDEPQDRALVGQGVVNVIDLRERRDHEERQAGAIAAATLRRQPETAVEWRCWRRRSLL